MHGLRDAGTTRWPSVLLALVLLSPLSLLAPPVAADDGAPGEPLPQFRASLANLGRAPDEVPDLDRTLWTLDTGSAVRASPVVTGGSVYVGVMDGRVLALNAYTGRVRWEFMTGGPVESSPAVDGGRVYVGSDDGGLYCLDAWGDPGDLLVWNFSTGSEIKSSPKVLDGRVYFGSNDFRVYCVDAVKGTQLWNFSTGGWVFSSPAVADGRVYFGSCDGRVYCLNASTGAKLWEFRAEYIPASPAVTGEHVIVGAYDGCLYWLDRETGEEVANFTASPSGIYSSAAVSSSVRLDSPYVYFGDNEGHFHQLSEQNRSLQDLEFGVAITSSPVLTSGTQVYPSERVIFGTEAGELVEVLFGLPTFQGHNPPDPVVNRLKLGASIQSSPFLYHGKVYVGVETEDYGGQVVCLGDLTEDDAYIRLLPLVPPEYEEGVVEVRVEVVGLEPDRVDVTFDGETRDAEPWPWWSTREFWVEFPSSPPEGKRPVIVRAYLDDVPILETRDEVMVLVEGWSSIDVDIERPRKGVTVDGVVLARGTASSNYTILVVKATWDDGDLVDCDGIETWEIALETRGLSDGRHTLKVFVQDEYRWTVEEVEVVVRGEPRDVGVADAVAVLVLLAVFVALLATRPKGPEETADG